MKKYFHREAKFYRVQKSQICTEMWTHATRVTQKIVHLSVVVGDSGVVGQQVVTGFEVAAVAGGVDVGVAVDAGWGLGGLGGAVVALRDGGGGDDDGGLERVGLQVEPLLLWDSTNCRSKY